MIKLINARKIYTNGQEKIAAVDGFTYEFKSAKMSAVMGRSGCGKSTLLHLIGGLDSVTDGKITIDSVDITELSEHRLSSFRRKNIGFVFQFFHLVPELTIKDNILLARQIARAKRDDNYFDELVDTLELTNRLNHLPGQVSGGQRQRTAIARALITKPRYLLLDEPTGNLDSVSSEGVVKVLVKLKKRFGQTVILVTHDSEVASVCETIVQMSNGRVADVIEKPDNNL